MNDAELETAWHRNRCEIAALLFELRLQKLILCLQKAYNPSQPRDELGRWTGGGSASRHFSDAQVAQNGPRPPRLPGSARIPINGREFEVSIQQQVRFEAATAASNSVIASVRQIDPSYRPRASVYEPGVEGEIAAREANARDAAMRLRDLTQSPYRADTLEDLVNREGKPIGYRYAGAREDIRTVSRGEFDGMVGRILCDPHVERIPPISPTYQGQTYRLRDGSVVGLRNSHDSGLSLDIQRPADRFYIGPDRIYYR